MHYTKVFPTHPEGARTVSDRINAFLADHTSARVVSISPILTDRFGDTGYPGPRHEVLVVFFNLHRHTTADQPTTETSPNPFDWANFHRLWGRAVGQPDYDKQAWNRLQRQIEALQRRANTPSRAPWGEG